MKEVLREAIWETNSSSVHSLVFTDNLEPPNLVKKGGYIYAHFDEFGSETALYFDQRSKLNYLVSYLFYLYGSKERMLESYKFGTLQEAVCEYTGAEGLKISARPKKPYFDHQTLPESDGGFLTEDFFYDKENIRNFLFNPNVGFKTWHD